MVSSTRACLQIEPHYQVNFDLVGDEALSQVRIFEATLKLLLHLAKDGRGVRKITLVEGLFLVYEVVGFRVSGNECHHPVEILNFKSGESSAGTEEGSQRKNFFQTDTWYI